MGQCAPRPTRPPSALQLCQDFDSRSRGASSQPVQARGQPSRSEAGVPQDLDITEGILQHLASDEVRALGEIVSSWAQGSLDSQTARRHVQFRVLRGQSALGIADPFGLGLIGGGIGPGMSPPSAAREDFSSAPPAQGAARHPGDVDAVAAPARPRAPGGGGGPPDMAARGAHSFFADLALSLMGGGPPMSQRPANLHEVFSTVDNVFFCRTFEDARDLAMRELDLDGPRPLPEEVQASFQRKARSILQDSARRQAGSAVWLDLVRLCLLVEVVRHVSDGIARSGSAPAAPRRTVLTPFPMFAPMQPGMPPHPAGGRMGSPEGAMDLVLVINSSSGNVAALGISGLPPGAGGGFRLDPEFLRGRVGVLLEVLVGAADARRPRGLSPEEIDRHCPSARCDNTAEDACPVCLETASAGDEVRKMPCGHSLHKECCEAWLATADTCPMCRYQVIQRQPEEGTSRPL